MNDLIDKYHDIYTHRLMYLAQEGFNQKECLDFAMKHARSSAEKEGYVYEYDPMTKDPLWPKGNVKKDYA